MIIMASKITKKITLVGFKQAKKGFSFLHSTTLEECKSCELLKTCMESLEERRIYTVIKVRNKVFPCPVHDEGVRVVEVEESCLEVALEPRLSFPLATITFHPQGCKNLRCNNSKVCSPGGLIDGDKCKILEVKERLECPLKRPLVRARVEREPEMISGSKRPL
jgi:uncharacterized protein (UPF0179 family)